MQSSSESDQIYYTCMHNIWHGDTCNPINKTQAGLPNFRYLLVSIVNFWDTS